MDREARMEAMGAIAMKPAAEPQRINIQNSSARPALIRPTPVFQNLGVSPGPSSHFDC